MEVVGELLTYAEIGIEAPALLFHIQGGVGGVGIIGTGVEHNLGLTGHIPLHPDVGVKTTVAPCIGIARLGDVAGKEFAHRDYSVVGEAISGVPIEVEFSGHKGVVEAQRLIAGGAEVGIA